MKIFETHAHYDDEQFDNDRATLLPQIIAGGVSPIINVGATMRGTYASVRFSEEYKDVYAAVGIHPSEYKDFNDYTIETLRTLADKPKVVAIGEIGLDYYWDKEEDVQAYQRKIFREQIALAKACNLPIIVHSRDAAKDTFDIIKEEAGGNLRGVIHCYSGSVEMAREYVKMGFYIGVGGVVTFKNAKTLVNVVEDIPLTSILLETDSPYMAPAPHRGERNNSTYLTYVAEKIAEIKNTTLEEVIKTTRANAFKLFDKVCKDNE
ncbi:MAG: TatD family hydrolase [Lachnospiraceae bacterium]|nr:TatD family hydrolase [Lachnospiraceae bacterium]